MITIDFRKPGAANEAQAQWAAQGIRSSRTPGPTRVADGVGIDVDLERHKAAQGLSLAQAIDPDATIRYIDGERP